MYSVFVGKVSSTFFLMLWARYPLQSNLYIFFLKMYIVKLRQFMNNKYPQWNSYYMLCVKFCENEVISACPHKMLKDKKNELSTIILMTTTCSVWTNLLCEKDNIYNIQTYKQNTIKASGKCSYCLFSSFVPLITVHFTHSQIFLL